MSSGYIRVEAALHIFFFLGSYPVILLWCCYNAIVSCSYVLVKQLLCKACMITTPHTYSVLILITTAVYARCYSVVSYAVKLVVLLCLAHACMLNNCSKITV
jgi:hypothetical protein